MANNISKYLKSCGLKWKGKTPKAILSKDCSIDMFERICEMYESSNIVERKKIERYLLYLFFNRKGRFTITNIKDFVEKFSLSKEWLVYPEEILNSIEIVYDGVSERFIFSENEDKIFEEIEKEESCTLKMLETIVPERKIKLIFEPERTKEETREKVIYHLRTSLLNAENKKIEILFKKEIVPFLLLEYKKNAV